MADPLITSAIRLGFSAASWLISPLLTHLLDKCFDALGIDPQFQSQKQILLVKLEKLETTLLPQLLILTDAAQQSPHRPFLNKWLQKLKSTFYEVEDVLGLVEYRRLEKEFPKGDVPQWVCNAMDVTGIDLSPCWGPILD